MGKTPRNTTVNKNQRAYEKNVDIVIASEFYKYAQNTKEEHGWYCDTSCRIAIVNINRGYPIEGIGNAEDRFRWITHLNSFDTIFD